MHWSLNMLLAIFILVLQHFLSTRNKAFWGAILPVSYVAFLIYLSLSGLIDVGSRDFWFIAILGTTILLGGWISGRESLEKKRKQELDKMTSHDLR
ncbi:hypothetical protein FPQ10_05515 [Allobacillus sp. SKP2-8]|uniref:hypothetical protein n=1 Tax=unclassified Allobacillus TaxID=2628859 RepID=UPI001182D75F|nr:hypothetical protein [Allobacillus sp. SKP2-8]TSJ68008.1 hypothetical protein FPQ10_05515 [Allobacillus sp. SKP2-8]